MNYLFSLSKWVLELYPIAFDRLAKSDSAAAHGLGAEQCRATSLIGRISISM